MKKIISMITLTILALLPTGCNTFNIMNEDGKLDEQKFNTVCTTLRSVTTLGVSAAIIADEDSKEVFRLVGNIMVNITPDGSLFTSDYLKTYITDRLVESGDTKWVPFVTSTMDLVLVKYNEFYILNKDYSDYTTIATGVINSIGEGIILAVGGYNNEKISGSSDTDIKQLDMKVVR